MERGGEEVKLGWKDYIAFVIALLTTHLLPLIIIAVIVVLICLLIVQFFG